MLCTQRPQAEVTVGMWVQIYGLVFYLPFLTAYFDDSCWWVYACSWQNVTAGHYFCIPAAALEFMLISDASESAQLLNVISALVLGPDSLLGWTDQVLP